MQTKKSRLRAGLLFVALAALLSAIVGCPPPGQPMVPVTDNVPMQTVLARVNRNARAMSFLMRAGGVSASGKLARIDGKTDSFDAHGTLYFRRPRNLYMELQHSLAGKLEIGSNDSEFWYWERFDHPRYYTGHYDRMSKPWETDVPLRPDQFLDMLGLQELPGTPAGAPISTFKVGKEHYFVNVYDRDTAGKAYMAKTFAISRRPPFLVSSITYYNPDNRPWMKADLLDYRPIEGTLVLTPRKIEVQSLEDASKMTLEFGNVKPSDNQLVEKQRIARSPIERGEKEVGQIIRMDRPVSGMSVTPANAPAAAAER